METNEKILLKCEKKKLKKKERKKKSDDPLTDS